MEKPINQNQSEKSTPRELNKYTYYDHSKGRDCVMFECVAPSIAEADLIFEKQFKKHSKKLSYVGCTIEKVEHDVAYQIEILPHEKFIELFNVKKKHANNVPSPAASLSVRQGEKINIKSMMIDQSFLPKGKKNEYLTCLFIHELAEAKYYERHLELYVKALEQVKNNLLVDMEAHYHALIKELRYAEYIGILDEYCEYWEKWLKERLAETNDEKIRREIAKRIQLRKDALNVVKRKIHRIRLED
ncbi:MAG: hypothetical protein V1928_03990 [Parcubacteria group bacterium]